MPYSRWELFAWSIEWEGSIFLTKNGTKKCKRLFQINARIGFVSKDRILLEKMLAIIQKGKVLPHGKKYHQWRICRLEDLVFILPKIIPFLITKKERAKIVLEWCKSRLKNWHKQYTKEELQIYKKFVECK